MELALKIVAVALLPVAAYFYSIEEKDLVFACIVLAACSFFLSLRFRIKKRMSASSHDAADGKDMTES